MNKQTICLRAETKANEYRTPLAPKDAQFFFNNFAASFGASGVRYSFAFVSARRQMVCLFIEKFVTSRHKKSYYL